MATRAVPVEYVLVCEAFHELVRLYGRGEPPAINVPDFREPTPEQRAEKGGAFDWLQAVVIDAIERGELEPLVLQADRQLSVPGYYWRGAFADLALAGETLCEIALEQDDRYLASHRLVFRRAEWQAWRDAFAAAVERHAGLPMQRDAPPAGRALPAGSISLRDAFRELLETLVSYRDVSLLLALQAGRSNDLPKRGRARLKELQDEAEALTLDALASGALPNRILTEPPAEPVTLSPKYWRHANGGVLSLHHGVVIANALHADDRARLAGRPIVLPDADFADWLCERRKALTPEPKVPEDGFTRAAWSLGQAVAWVFARDPDIVARFAENADPLVRWRAQGLPDGRRRWEPLQEAHSNRDVAELAAARGGGRFKAVADAEVALVAACVAGRVAASGAREGAAEPEPIPPPAWRYLKVAWRKRFHWMPPYLADDRDGTSRWNDVRFNREDIVREFPAGEAVAPIIDAAGDTTVERKPRRFGKNEIEAAYKEHVADHIARGEIPSLNAEVAILGKRLGAQIPRDRVRELRKAHAPDHWKARGRRKVGK